MSKVFLNFFLFFFFSAGSSHPLSGSGLAAKPPRPAHPRTDCPRLLRGAATPKKTIWGNSPLPLSPGVRRTHPGGLRKMGVWGRSRPRSTFCICILILYFFFFFPRGCFSTSRSRRRSWRPGIPGAGPGAGGGGAGSGAGS